MCLLVSFLLCIYLSVCFLPPLNLLSVIFFFRYCNLQMSPSPAPPSLLQETCANLVSCLGRSVAGIPAEQLCCNIHPIVFECDIILLSGDYRNMVGEGIPFRRLGFDSLGSFLCTVPQTCSVRRLPRYQVYVVTITTITLDYYYF